MSIISPLNQKFIMVSSETATSYKDPNFTTGFTYDFETITCPDTYTMALRLDSFFCPYSFYGVNEYNCWLDVREVEAKTNTTRTRSVMMPFGNYYIRDFGIQMTSLLNALNDIVYVLDVNRNQNTFTISVNVGWQATLLFATGTHSATSCRNQLGFKKNDYLLNPRQSSDQICMMFDILSLSLKMDLVNNIVVSKDNTDNVLALIPIEDKPFSIISYRDPATDKRYLLSQRYINMLTISLVDNNNNLIQLNGKHFYFTLQIDFIPNAKYGLPQVVDARAQFARLMYSIPSYVDGDRMDWDPKKWDQMIKESLAEENQQLQQIQKK